ncbi:MAG: ferrochelatase [Bdellovibrionota bacterium]
MDDSTRKGILLLNLGTPDFRRQGAVARYSAEFLMDLTSLIFPGSRWLLVYGFVLPKRPFTSSAAYKKIWTEDGSPACTTRLNSGFKGGSKSSERLLSGSGDAVRKAFHSRGCRNPEGIRSPQFFTVLPLYPQYSLAATESSIAETKNAWETFPIPCCLPVFIPDRSI